MPKATSISGGRAEIRQSIRAIGVLALYAASLSGQQTDVSEFSRRIGLELRQQNLRAADVFDRANEARNAEDYAEAEQLYRRVRELQPGFHHATRRLCGVLAGFNRRTEALRFCREALSAADTQENRVMLLHVLTRSSRGRFRRKSI